jgi:hypothetical protein
MPDEKKPYGSSNRPLHQPKVLSNPPTSSVSQALAQNQAQIDQAKSK